MAHYGARRHSTRRADTPSALVMSRDKAQQEAIKSASGMDGKLLALARLHFDDDETDLRSVRGSYETKRLGSDSVRNGILIATNKRAVFYAKKAVGHDIKHIRYRRFRPSTPART